MWYDHFEFGFLKAKNLDKTQYQYSWPTTMCNNHSWAETHSFNGNIVYVS